MIDVTPVIFCGGSGTRLWPVSRARFPKQFVWCTRCESLFQQAAKRLVVLGTSRICVSSPIALSNEEHRVLTTRQLKEVDVKPGAALLEPVGRNPAPALTLDALRASETGRGSGAGRNTRQSVIGGIKTISQRCSKTRYAK